MPASIRESVVETLGTTIRWGRILHGLIEPFQAFMAKTAAVEVLALCSGSGLAVRVLLDALRRHGSRTPCFVLTDLYPRAELWEVLRREAPGSILFVREPVDALDVPAELGEAPEHSAHYRVLFLTGVLLFSMSFIVNLSADLIIKGIRRK